MKLIKGIATLIVLVVLVSAIAVMLAAGLIRFVAMNPLYLKTFMPSKSYCAELHARISDDLDHVALLYGFGEGELGDLVTDDAIRAYTNATIDALYGRTGTEALQLPTYPADAFAAYARAHTSYSEQGVKDFSEDCATAVQEDLASIDVDLITGRFAALRETSVVKYSLVLFFAGLLLALLMLIFLRLMYLGRSKRAGTVVIRGGLFMGVTLVFVPVMQFLLFGYVDRLNVSVSAFRTILTGYLNTILYGWFVVLLALEVLTALLLLVAVIRASKKRSGKSGKNA